MLELRYDSASLSPLPKTAAGYLRVPGKLTRLGIFHYTQPDGTIRRELRRAEDVFNADSLDSLRLVPVTHGHPKNGLDAKLAKVHARGAVGDIVSHDDMFVTATVGIYDQDLIDAIERGESELSCGYQCDLDMTPGEYAGEKYDAIQTNIRYNHLAVVPRGRAGPDVALKLDSADKGGRVAMIKLGDKDFECPQEVADAYAALQRENAELKTKVSANQATAAEQGARADAAIAAANKIDVRSLVKARVSLEREAQQFVSTEKMDSLDDVALKTEVIKSILPKMNLDGFNAGQIDAAYTVAISTRPSATQTSLAAVRAPAQRNDQQLSAHDAMVKRQANAWKGQGK